MNVLNKGLLKRLMSFNQFYLLLYVFFNHSCKVTWLTLMYIENLFSYTAVDLNATMSFLVLDTSALVLRGLEDKCFISRFDLLSFLSLYSLDSEAAVSWAPMLPS